MLVHNFLHLRQIFAIAVFALLCIYGHAQQQPVYYTITEKDGLTDNHINCFFQDHNGVMWMGTNYGLNSYDGSDIKKYRAGAGETSLCGDVINDIKEDDGQCLWIATSNGLSCYNIYSARFTSYRFNKAGDEYNRFYSLAITQNDILLATEVGVVFFNKKSHLFTLVQNPDKAPGNNRLTKVFVDRGLRIWLCTYNGLWRLNNNVFTCYNSPLTDSLFDGLITDMYEDTKAQLWFGTWNKGLKKLLADSKKTISYLYIPGSSANLLNIAEVKNSNNQNELWVCDNLRHLTEDEKAFIPFTNPVANHGGFAAYKIYTDKNNLVWISTDFGVLIYNPAKQYFSTTQLSSFVPLTSQNISLFPLKNSFLIGAEDHSALLLFSNNPVKQIKNLSQAALRGSATTSISIDKQHHYWLSSSIGLSELDSNFNKVTFYQHNDKNPSSLPKNFVNSVLHLKNGQTWVMPWRRGVWQLNKSTGKFSAIVLGNGDTLLNHANISKALEDKNGNIWVTDYSGGLSKYIVADKKLLPVIRGERLTNQYLLGDTLCTVSSQYIYLVNTNNNYISRISLPEGKNKYEYDFLPDKNGWLWIATKTGLLAYCLKTKALRQYTSGDGLYSDLLDVSLAQLSNGNIIMVGGNYATAFTPAIVNQNNTPANLLFTGAMHDGINALVQNGNVYYNYNDLNIQLYWALTNFSNPQQNSYYYKVDELHGQWQPAGNKGFAVFSYLAPGKYTFRFKAATADGIMAAEKMVTIVVAPPFWQRWWFRLAIFMVFAAGFYGLVRYLSQRKLKQQIVDMEKQQAIEKERNRISRDMHDELGSGLTKIAVLTEVIKANRNTTETNIEKISETARALVDNLDEMVWSLNPKNDTLDNLVAYITEYAYKYLDGTGINCQVQLPQSLACYYISESRRRNIFMVTKEFLNNTVKHSGCANVFIMVQQQDDVYKFILSDDGKGLGNKASLNSSGLIFMQQRIADAGGQASIRSSAKGVSLTMVFNRQNPPNLPHQ